MLNPLTFIYPYQPSDRAIRIIDSTGKVTYTINICSYQKSGVQGNTLSIVLEDGNKDYKLVFATNNAAKQAFQLFRQALDTLRPNCTAAIPYPGGSGEPATAPIAITYLQYKVLRENSTLIPRQWYDVTDTTNLLFSEVSYVIRLQPLTNYDRQPRGHIIANDVEIVIDAVKDMVVEYIDAEDNNRVINGDADVSSFTTSTNNTALNSSQIIAMSSDFIFAANDSIVNAESSFQIKADNASNVRVKNASNVTFDNIQFDFTTLGFNLTNVSIDKNMSKGKGGRTTALNAAGSLILESYFDFIDQDFNYTSNGNSLVLILDNKIHQANAEFRVRLLGTGTSNQITVKNLNDTVLYVIKDNDRGNTVNFTFNKLTNLFEVSGVSTFAPPSGKTIRFTNVTTNQTVFNLNFPVSDTNELEMFVNGQKQTNGLDYSYDLNLQKVVWAARYFLLMPGDEIEFKVY